jgi:hypothetical protein
MHEKKEKKSKTKVSIFFAFFECSGCSVLKSILY